MVKTAVNFLGAILAFAVAYLWLRSAKVRVSADEKIRADAFSMVYLDKNGKVDLVATTKEASEWNAWAARAASLAALLQGIGLLIHD